MGFVPINVIFTERNVFLFQNHPKDPFAFALKDFIKPFEELQGSIFQSQDLR